ncbi:hypothetical protein ACROYT_G024166 [Oculina patagonica]
MADRGQFTEAEKKQMEMFNKQFSARQRYFAQIKRRNLAVFACLVASVGGIYGYTLFATRQEQLDFDE